MSLKTLLVKREAEGKTLLHFLKTHLSGYPSVKAIKRAIERKQCTINGCVETFSTHRVKATDLVAISLELEHPDPVKILYQDEALIAYDKPPYVCTEHLCSDLPVHRLDKETSGIILFAKVFQVQKKLEEIFAKRQIKKTYLVICDGHISRSHWTVDNYLKPRVRYQGGLLMGKANKRTGKRAITHFEVIKRSDKATLVVATPSTGRTHQIRVHLAGGGNPVLGDWQYSKKFLCPLFPKRLMLHALSLSFLHPIKDVPLILEAKLRTDFLQMQKSLFSH